MLHFCGHTMGVPGMDIVEAMRFFARLGFDGIEIRVSDQGTIRPADFGPALAGPINRTRRETGLAVACLTPYFRQFHVPAARDAEMAGMRATVEMALRVECRLVRVFAAKNPPMTGPEHQTAWTAWVDAMRTLGREAATRGVQYAIETHDGTFVPTLADAVRLVKDIGLANVGILLDYGNVFEAGPPGRAAVRLAAPYLKHVHMKDFRRGPDGSHQTVEFGAGNIGWPEVLDELAVIGYDGYVSDEYEKLWQPDLPPAEVAMKQHIDWLRAWREKRSRG